MKDKFSFSTFCEMIDEKKERIVEDQYGQNYVLMVIQNQISTGSIDFSKFLFEDIVNVYHELDNVLSGEDTDGNIAIDPNHSYTRILALSEKIYKMGKLPKQRPTSPFLFL
ncbi:hypothetical protein C0966_17255 (plasmid) [Bacillus methanolicus]|uniref:hypothetical protein n=1 Tax=Bacillus methanolicus TaxID=1471 RepID=UPI002380A42C|nr:hypothetical protein [Bacillus methanolicus]MDE3841014.1 hypothetical protein [Bacillus methanolicus]